MTSSTTEAGHDEMVHCVNCGGEIYPSGDLWMHTDTLTIGCDSTRQAVATPPAAPIHRATLREPHAFDPIHKGSDECWCGLLKDAPLHPANETPAEQHCGHCDGLLVWGFNSYVHADPKTECLAFGGRQLQPASDPAVEGETLPSCAICGGKRVRIRGRFPHDPEREVCPTCLAERMEQIQEITSMEYGAASSHEQQ